MIRIIKKENIDKLKKELSKSNKLIDARKEKILSLKKYFFLPEEETFVFNRTKKKLQKPDSKPKPFIIFGLNLRDTEALIQLDEIMRTPTSDFYYFEKRNVSTIISIIDKNGGLTHGKGIDLVLEKMSANQYQAHALTKKGEDITKSILFKQRKSNFKTNYKRPDSKKMPKLRKMLLDPELLKDAVKWSWKGAPKIWEDLGKKCLGCGVCTYVCPICHCFSTEDRCSLNGKTCTKSRKWTACTLPEFSQVTGGHKFHKTIKERYYNWFYHKFVRAYKEYGKSQCVACGRCQEQCPAGIDIEAVLINIVDKYQKQ